MKIVNYGERYEIYPDDLKTFDTLPAQTYKVGFHPMQGFYLTKVKNLESKEEKIYGNHTSKVNKIMNTFGNMNRSLGAIFSGDKGIGKTMSVQLLSNIAIERGLPVIIVDENYKGIVNYLDTIEQEAVIIFDEFEKKFSKLSGDSDGTSQEDFLSLFDGMSVTKRLYIVTVNELNKLNDYLLNRPGRFHYHIRYDYPKYEEIVEYLNDKLENVDPEEIEKVADFGMRTSLNYDMLRAITFELAAGGKFKEFIHDLNIIDLGSVSTKAFINHTDGTRKEVTLGGSLFGEAPMLDIHDRYEDNEYVGRFSFDNSKVVRQPNGFLIAPEHIITFDVTREFLDEEQNWGKEKVSIGKITSIVVETKSDKVAYGYPF